MRKNLTIAPLSLTLMSMLLLLFALPVYGQEIPAHDSGLSEERSAAPENRPISTLEELLQWHDSASAWNEYPVLSGEVVVDRPVTLSETAGPKDLGAIDYGIRVTAGGSLTLHNSKLAIMGLKPIVVESGGRLLLECGAIYTPPGADAAVVEKGGQIVTSAAFLIDGGKITDKNEENELPGEPEPDPDPPVNTSSAITNTIGFDFSLSCMEGEPPAPADYPPTGWVTFEAEPNVPVQMELPVKWLLEDVNFDVAGTYPVKGIFTADVLASNHLSNPDNIFATLQLTVLKPGAIDILTGNVLSVGSQGECLIRLALPPLPADVSALYIYRSADGQHWRKAVQETYTGGNIPASYDDFLPHITATPSKTYVPWRYQTDYRPIWLRIEVIGSAIAGVSNEIRLEMPEGSKPGDNINTGENGGDGSSEGNRGGGGQSESDRELPNMVEKPAAAESFAAAENSPLGYITTSAVTSPAFSASGGEAPSPEALKEQTAGNTEQQRKREGALLSASAQGTDSPTSSHPLQQPREGASGNMEDTKTAAVVQREPAAGPQDLSASQKSRGVFLTAAATALAVGALLLARKIHILHKRGKNS